MNEQISVQTVIAIKFPDGSVASLPEADPSDTPGTQAALTAFRTALLANHPAPAPVVASAPVVAQTPAPQTGSQSLSAAPTNASSGLPAAPAIAS